MLNAEAFVLLDNIGSTDGREREPLSDNSQESMNNVVIKSEPSDLEEVDISRKLKVNDYGSPGSSRHLQSPGCIRDDDDDDIEYIEIDDDDPDDDVDVIEEDDDDDDIEEYEEEIVHNDDDEEDYEDVEVVEIDDDDERDLDGDYLTEINEGESNTSEDSKVDKNVSNSVILSIKEKINCDESDSLKCNQPDKDLVPLKNENLPSVSVQDIKLEVVEDFNEKDTDMEISFLPVDDVVKSSSLPAEPQQQDILSSEFSEASDIKGSKPLPTLPLSLSTTSTSSSTTSTFISSSWTKEEDKVILQTFQQEGDSDENFIMIRKQLPQRTVEEVFILLFLFNIKPFFQLLLLLEKLFLHFIIFLLHKLNYCFSACAIY